MLIFALSAPAVLGVAGLASEAGFWFLVRMRAQSAADFAAIAGAIRLTNSQPNQNLPLSAAQQQARDAAADIAGLNGFTAGTVGGTTTTVTVNTPPSAPSAYINDTTAVQVKITRQMPRLLSALFLGSDPVISVTSTSKLVPIAPGACVLALSGSLSMGGSSSINADSCVVGSNVSGNSIQLSNNASVTAKLISAVGTCNGCGGGTPYKINQPPLRDPFQSLQSLTYPTSCPSGSAPAPTSYYVSNPTGTLYWCNSFSLTSSLDLAPGTYILYDASLSLTGSAVLTCSSCQEGLQGVTLVLTGSSANSVGTLSLAGSSGIQLVAPSAGPYSGVVIYRDKLASNGTINFTGGSNTDIVGGVYAPTSNIKWNGGTSSTTSDCHALVAASLSFGGNATGSVRNCSRLGLVMLGNGNFPTVE